MMRYIALFIIYFLTSTFYAQNTGLIVGKIMDEALNHAPLVFANISIKGTQITTTTDLTGLFLIEDLNVGDYTLVCSFAGYETKEINISLVSGKPTEIKLSLGAKSISLAQLTSISGTSQNEIKEMVVLH